MMTLVKKKCHDCTVEPGELHKPGCDSEQCPLCGRQLISCGCLSDKENEAWIEQHLVPWSGLPYGTEEAIEFGLFAKWVPNAKFEADKEALGLEKALKNLHDQPLGRWKTCDKEDPEAIPNWNDLVRVCAWDREKRRFVKQG